MMRRWLFPDGSDVAWSIGIDSTTPDIFSLCSSHHQPSLKNVSKQSSLRSQPSHLVHLHLLRNTSRHLSNTSFGAIVGWFSRQTSLRLFWHGHHLPSSTTHQEVAGAKKWWPVLGGGFGVGGHDAWVWGRVGSMGGSFVGSNCGRLWCVTGWIDGIWVDLFGM